MPISFVFPHGPWTPILIAAHLNALATTRNGIMIEYPSPDVFPSSSTRSKYLKLLFEQGFENTLKLRNGFLQLPDAPGLGLGDYNSEVFKELNSLGDG
jgi:L-alanine-DL-glutamate epimerase-like enolase superfamily enzyme